MTDSRWALILGASSGFGAAIAKELSGAGYDICGVHLDMGPGRRTAEELRASLEASGRRAIFFNVNAADHEKRQHVLDQLASETGDGYVQVLVHSLAFGTTLPLFAPEGEATLSPRQMEMTLDVMANSLVYWVQDALKRDLLRQGSRIFAMTSGGSTRVIRNYGAVSAAKAALEANIRQIAFELAPKGITANALRAGMTDTPAMRKIPGASDLYGQLAARHPAGRATTPEDVARAVKALAGPDTAWISGEVIGVDNTEHITAA
ncbi:MAG TPA: SDR family oxidoreductase [Dehalococcoidia bacterium]|nr:SDR family oxidoreductase [Dehalococcoidia bacterium]